MSRSRLFQRLGAGAVATALATVGLTAAFVSPASAGAITDVQPPFAFTDRTGVEIEFTASQVFFPGRASIRLVRTGSTPPSACPEAGCEAGGRLGQTQENVTTFAVNDERNNVDGDTRYVGVWDFKTEAGALGPANPDTYDLIISEPRVVGTVEDSCSRCFTILGTGTPTVTSTSVPNLRPGTTVSAYSIKGSNFTRGTGVEVLFGGSPDPTVRVFAQDLTSSNDPNPDTATEMTKKLIVQTNAPGGARDLRVFNTDGSSSICARCLSIDSLLVDAVNPGAADNRGVKRIAITGSRFTPGGSVALTRFPAVDGQPDIVGTDVIFVDNFNGTQTISATYDLTGAAPGANAYIPRVTNPDGAVGHCTCRFSIAGFAPTATSLDPNKQQPGTDDAPTALLGTNLARGAKITFSNPGVTAAPGSIQWASMTRLDFLVDVASNAAPGPSDVTVTNTDGQSATCAGCFTVEAAPEPTPTATATAEPSPSATEEPSASPTSQPPPPARDNGLYTPLDPSRILDTREGTGGPRSPLGPGETRSFRVWGQGGVPTGASAVAFNLTAITPTAGGYLTAFPSGTTRPNASNINFVNGDIIANLVIVKIGTDGRVNLYNHRGSTHVAADVVGYFAEPPREAAPSASAEPSASASVDPSASAAPSESASAEPSATASPTSGTGTGTPGGRYTPLNPQRILDTRSGNGGSFRPIGPGESRQVQVRGRAGIPSSATAVVFNLTVDRPTAQGFLTAFPTGTLRPTASNINFRQGEVIANLVIARIGAGGSVSIYNQSGETHTLADVVGYYSPATNAASYTSLEPQRIFDTRSGANSPARPLAPGESRSFRVTNLGGVASNASAVVFNLTVDGPTASGYLTAFPAGTTRPEASNINFRRGDVIANLVIVRVGSSGQVTLFNQSGSTHAIADVVGYFGPFDPSATPTASPSAAPTSAAPSPSASVTPSATATATVTATPAASGTPSASGTPAASATTSAVPVSSRQRSSSGTGGGDLLFGVVMMLGVGVASGLFTSHGRYARRH